MTPFFITGLPRSRTAWLSNLFTTGESFCFHDGLKEGFDVTRLATRMFSKKSYKYVGDCDSALTFHWFDIQKIFPTAKWLFVKRDSEACRKSYEAHFQKDIRFMPAGVNMDTVWSKLESNYSEAIKKLNGRVLECDYEDLNSLTVIEKLFHWLTPEAPFDMDRAVQLQEFRINIIPEKVEIVWQ